MALTSDRLCRGNAAQAIRFRWRLVPFVIAIIAAGVASCRKVEPPAVIAPPYATGQLLRVGSIIVTQSDLDLQLKDQHAGRNDESTRGKALAELGRRAQTAQAALDAGFLNDPVVRAEMARVLASRLKDETLNPRLKALAAPIPEARLRELYAAGETRFRSPEKREAAVLWLNPGSDPERKKQYEEKLAAARDWLAKTPDVKDHPDKGFSVMSVDYSEHQASRYQGGAVGWLEQAGGLDPWTKAVAEIVFSLKAPGEVSAVITDPAGVFLVRCMAIKPAVVRPFDAVRKELEQAELTRLRQEMESEHSDVIRAKYPVEVLNSARP